MVCVVSSITHTIAAMAEEQNAATEQVSASTEEISAQVEEMAAQAQELAATADGLRDLVAQFQLTNRPVAAPAQARELPRAA